MTYLKSLVHHIKTNGDLSLDLNSETSPTTGYMVSLPNAERRISLANFGYADLASYVNYNAKELFQGNALLGAWIDNGTVYLDLSINVPDLDNTMLLAQKYNQLAIYDVSNGKTIYITDMTNELK